MEKGRINPTINTLRIILLQMKEFEVGTLVSMSDIQRKVGNRIHHETIKVGVEFLGGLGVLKILKSDSRVFVEVGGHVKTIDV